MQGNLFAIRWLKYLLINFQTLLSLLASAELYWLPIVAPLLINVWLALQLMVVSVVDFIRISIRQLTERYEANNLDEDYLLAHYGKLCRSLPETA
jgi:hypothetical protein